MKVYKVRIWQEDDWWLARVVDCNEAADPAPVNRVTQSRTPGTIYDMVRDLITTILDDETAVFEVAWTGEFGQ